MALLLGNGPLKVNFKDFVGTHLFSPATLFSLLILTISLICVSGPQKTLNFSFISFMSISKYTGVNVPYEQPWFLFDAGCFHTTSQLPRYLISLRGPILFKSITSNLKAFPSPRILREFSIVYFW